MTQVFVRLPVQPPSLRSEALALIHEAGNPYYDWLLGGPTPARAALERLYSSETSEISASRVTFLLEDQTLRGLYVALVSQELARSRLTDALLLLGSTRGATRTELRHRLEVARGVFADIPPNGLYLSKIAVVSTSRDRGLGGMILDRVIDEALEGGYSHLRLEVHAANECALALYASRGFTVVGERGVESLAYLELVRTLSPD